MPIRNQNTSLTFPSTFKADVFGTLTTISPVSRTPSTVLSTIYRVSKCYLLNLFSFIFIYSKYYLLYFLLTLGFILLSEASVLGWDAGVNLKEISFSEINFPVDLFSWICVFLANLQKFVPQNFFYTSARKSRVSLVQFHF